MIPFCSLQDYFPDYNDFPMIESRIINGLNATEGQFCYYVEVIQLLQNANRQYCGGSLIRADFVLTAAHCCYPPSNATQIFSYRVNAGSIITRQAQQSRTVEESQVTVHPEFSRTTLNNDIALIKVPVFTFNRLVCQINLVPSSWRYESYVGRNITALGLGYISNAGEEADNLRWTDELTIIPMNNCTPFYTVTLPSNIFCAVDLGDVPDSATCSGDSGGPVIVYANDNLNRPIQIGLVSFGRSDGCDTGPQGFVDIAKYRAWISETTIPIGDIVNTLLDSVDNLLGGLL
ncbi:serine protease 3-like [Phlebotomus argentipes]|uniref:serine protease 3-like n=1 Tax=Phlebotomus argentipes TaxID=94469 RepID=UPI0028932556|nr:serine protease 3-like [Phlebotomus argentipes]